MLQYVLRVIARNVSSPHPSTDKYLIFVSLFFVYFCLVSAVCLVVASDLIIETRIRREYSVIQAVWKHSILYRVQKTTDEAEYCHGARKKWLRWLSETD